MAKKSTTTPSLTQLKKILSEAAFDPRKPGPMAIVVGMQDTRYLETKILEMTTEARDLAARIRLLKRAPASSAVGSAEAGEVIRLESEYRDKMCKVAALAALSVAFKDNGLVEGA